MHGELWASFPMEHAHELRVTALHRAVHKRAHHEHLLLTVLQVDEIVVLNVASPIVGAQEVPLTHALRRQLLHSDLKSFGAIHWCPRPMPGQLEHEMQPIIALIILRSSFPLVVTLPAHGHRDSPKE